MALAGYTPRPLILDGLETRQQMLKRRLEFFADLCDLLDGETDPLAQAHNLEMTMRAARMIVSTP